MTLNVIFTAKPQPKTNKIPLAEYKGPVLNLTPEDNKLIESIKTQKANFIESTKMLLIKIQRNLKKTLTPTKRAELKIIKKEIEDKINAFDEEILNIKKNRFAQQRTEWEKQQGNILNKTV